MKNNKFLSDFARYLNASDFDVNEIEKSKILRNRLFFFLKLMGYGYASLGILRRLIKKDKYNRYEILEIFEDCNIREGIIELNNPIDERIKYNKNIGINKSYSIKYNNFIGDVGPILWDDKKLFSCNGYAGKVIINLNICSSRETMKNKREIIAVLFGKRARKYNFIIKEENSKDNFEVKSIVLPERVNKIKRKIELGGFPLYDLLVIESEFLSTPFLTTDILKLLKNLYIKGYYSDDSIKIINILNKTLDKDMNNVDILFIEAKFKNFNVEFLKKICEVPIGKENDKLDFIINKVVNGSFEFYEPFLETIYFFYKRNNDINALLRYIELCNKHNINMALYGFKEEDRIKLNVYVKNLNRLGYKMTLDDKLE